jgi:hypothetical protein
MNTRRLLASRNMGMRSNPSPIYHIFTTRDVSYAQITYSIVSLPSRWRACYYLAYLACDGKLHVIHKYAVRCQQRQMPDDQYASRSSQLGSQAWDTTTRVGVSRLS